MGARLLLTRSARPEPQVSSSMRQTALLLSLFVAASCSVRAGNSDSGIDSGLPADSGTPDSGTPDSGDSGAPDAGPPPAFGTLLPGTITGVTFGHSKLLVLVPTNGAIVDAKLGDAAALAAGTATPATIASNVQFDPANYPTVPYFAGDSDAVLFTRNVSGSNCDFYSVTPDGHEVLTRVPRDLETVMVG